MSTSNKIWRDKHGVCHVEGKDKTDIFNLMGYVHGKDRGMQILLMRILGQGRASEFLDSSDEMLEIDKFFRRMNWTGSIASQIEKFSPDTREVIDAYCAGVNRAFAQKIPWEFKLFRFKPEPWCIKDTVLISRMIGYLTLAQSQGEMERLFIEFVQAGMDEDRLNELFPGILGGLDMDLIKKIKLADRLVSPASLWNIAAPVMMASNNWAVSGKKTASGKPILSNDPHLEINRLPNIWYEIVLKTKDGYAMGGTMPGAPALLVGRNQDLAWSATYTFMDGIDSWIEKCKDGKYMCEPDKWSHFIERKETIKRKKKDSVKVVFYENKHGILEGNPNEEGYYITTSWAPAFSGAVTLDSIIKIFDAKTVTQGMDLLGRVETSWNFILADKDGNIGYQMSGLMPKRREGVTGFVPLPGWEEKNDWQGFESPQDLPRCYNPESGYFVTSNQNLNEYGNVHPINVGMGSYRSDRIGKLLLENNEITRETMYKLHYDVYSIQAQLFMKILGPLLPDTTQGKILKNWNLEYSADSKGAFLFDKFYKALYLQVFGENGFGTEAVEHIDKHTGMFNDFYINFDRILLSENSVWFGNNTREELYLKAAKKALKVEPEKWGNTRKVMMKNILFDGKLPKFLGFDRGPITIIGGLATPHQGQVFESAGRQTTFAPSFRMVIDLSTDEINTNMAGGPSDRRFSKWYCSDLENWISGKYKTIAVNAEKKFKI
ncbi:MAG: penicillin acylase family protein [Desulfobacula sp.]|uniref:penicillin acylase family protein n=1 Tax=Desulfobacula sp. TaxID=2593537 RepID=UPI0025C47B2A|nr:penicillin acylase family protein [Desulfobacula sp.]MCD4720981.1 penicillin acylase family protein [Desulfobacula sp.]